MKYRVVKTEKGKVSVDESAEIKEGAYYFNHKLRTCQKRTSGTDDESYVGFCKITATINHSIDKDVPMVVVEDNEAERLMKFLKGRQHKAAQQNGGYSEAKQKSGYSEEDVDHLEWIYDRLINVHSENKNYDYMLKFNEIIQSLAVIKEYIELEFINEPIYTGDDCHDDNWILKTDRVAGQLRAYVKTNLQIFRAIDKYENEYQP